MLLLPISRPPPQQADHSYSDSLSVSLFHLSCFEPLLLFPISGDGGGGGGGVIGNGGGGGSGGGIQIRIIPALPKLVTEQSLFLKRVTQSIMEHMASLQLDIFSSK